MTWVKEVAQAFLNGYSAGHTVVGTIAMGVSNQNSPWICDNTTPNIDSKWSEAGTVWGNFTKSLTQPARTSIVAANDVEGWRGDDPDNPTWVSCGAGTIAWYQAFHTSTARLIYNFGSNVFNQVGLPNWTEQQQYDVAYGLPSARVIPEIYCNGNAGPWVTLVQHHPGLLFAGVTSDNAAHFTCSATVRSYTWLVAWQTLYNALGTTYRSNLAQNVESFDYP